MTGLSPAEKFAMALDMFDAGLTTDTAFAEIIGVPLSDTLSLALRHREKWIQERQDRAEASP